jgi:hypothetical protein
MTYLSLDLFSQIACLKKATGKWTFLCFNAALGTVHEDLHTFFVAVNLNLP